MLQIRIQTLNPFNLNPEPRSHPPLGAAGGLWMVSPSPVSVNLMEVWAAVSDSGGPPPTFPPLNTIGVSPHTTEA